MKKSLLALAVLGAVAGVAQAQSSVTVYGIVDQGVTYSSNAGTDAQGQKQSNTTLQHILQGSRLGFKGTEDLGGGLKALFNIEAGFNPDTGTSAQGGVLFGRRAVVGLASGFGTVTLGRQTDILDDIGYAYTSTQDFGFTAAALHPLDRTGGDRTNNSIKYQTNDLNGFTGSAIYGFGEQAGSTKSGQAYGIGANYANGPFGIGAGYYQAKFGKTPADTDTPATAVFNAAFAPFTTADGNTASKTWTVGASYQLGAARLYGAWSQTKVPALANIKTDVVDLGVSYALTSELKLNANVEHGRAKADGTTITPKLTQINLGTDYALSKRTDVYALYNNQRSKDGFGTGIFAANGNEDNVNAVSVGIRHKF